MRSVACPGRGSQLPLSAFLTNAEIAKRVLTLTDEWIAQRTGIR